MRNLPVGPQYPWGRRPVCVLHFGRKRLLSAPAFRIEELAYGGVYIQVTENVTDIERDFDAFDQARNAIKAPLDNDSFWDPSLPENHVYHTPESPTLEGPY